MSRKNPVAYAGARSERDAWAKVAEIGLALMGARELTVKKRGDELVKLATGMLTQVASGVHKNPGLVTFGNPPGGTFEIARHMSDDVHEIRYTHKQDRKQYRHPFEGDVQMFAITRGPGPGGPQRRDILITHRDGKSLWEDF